MTADNNPQSGEHLNIEDIPVPFFKRFYVKVSAIVTVILWIIGTTYFLINYFYVTPLENQLNESKSNLQDVKSQNVELRSKTQEAIITLSNINQKILQPILVFPKDGNATIGNKVTFVWDCKNPSQDQKYILEIYEPCTRTLKTLNVVHPELSREFYTFEDNSIHEILWRVRQGEILGGKIISTGPWSSSSRLTLFPSFLSKLKTTKILQVATTPSSYGPFTKVDGQGNYSGFDLDLITYLVKKMSVELDIPGLNIQIEEVQWKDLLNSINNGDFDVGVKAITRTREREKEYRNIAFTNGYLPVNQLFIEQKPGGNYPASLKNAMVGVKKGSTNEILAKRIAVKYGFNINSGFINYGDLYQALNDGKIDFALVDYPLVADYLKQGNFYMAGSFIKEPAYVVNTIGYPKEAYSVAVYNPDSKAELVGYINRILAEDDTRQYINQLRKKYAFNLITDQ